MGTPDTMYDSTGKEVWSCELNSYGAVRKIYGKKDDCPFRYQGQYEDAETGLYYNRYRYYSTDTGGYLSQDPTGLFGGTRLYSYVHDTNSWIDPLGLIKTSDTNGGKGYDIYVIKNNNDDVIYVGQTNEYNRREAEHVASGRLKPEMTMERIDHVDNYGQARGYEQYYMDKYTTVDTSQRGVYDSDGKIPAGAEGNRARSYDEEREDDRAKDFKEAYKKAKENDKDLGTSCPPR